MTPEEISEIEARAEAATPGPWEGSSAFRWYPHKDVEPLIGVLGPNDENAVCWVPDEWDQWEANNSFIAHAREDIPKLMAEVRRQKKEITEVRGLLERARFYVWAVDNEKAYVLNERILSYFKRVNPPRSAPPIAVSGTPLQEAPAFTPPREGG
jgi:hypothetical protein